MKRLTMEQKTRVVAALVEGNSIRSTVRMTGVAKNTVIKLVLDLADACAAHHDRAVRNVRVRRLQCDEIWQFVGSKAKNTSPEKKAIGWGDVWTWTAIDADTKLCVSYLVGGRDLGWAKEFMRDCASRIRNRVQITTDAHKAYLDAVEDAFGADIDYAQLQKVYGAAAENHTRYSPAQCIGCEMKTVSGNPDPKHVSTSFVERQNLSMRMSIRRFTRLTNGFSKKIENHVAAVAIWFMYYNFCRVHSTLRVTPAMEAGIADHVWTIEEMCALLPRTISASRQAERELTQMALTRKFTISFSGPDADKVHQVLATLMRIPGPLQPNQSGFKGNADSGWVTSHSPDKSFVVEIKIPDDIMDGTYRLQVDVNATMGTAEYLSGKDFQLPEIHVTNSNTFTPPKIEVKESH